MAGSAWISDGRVVTLLERNLNSPSRIRLTFDAHSLAVNSAGMVMYVNDTCRMPATIRLRLATGKEKDLPGLDKLLNGSRMRVDGMALAASGRAGAFVVRPCEEKANPEVSELKGIVYVVSTRDLRVTRLIGSLDDEGLPIGMASSPKFSPSEKELLVDYEASFEVYGLASGRSIFKSSSLSAAAEGWTGSIGWHSGACIAFKAGVDWLARDLKPPMAVNFASGEVVNLGSLTGIPAEKLIGITEVSSDHAIRRTSLGQEVVSLRSGSTISRMAHGTRLTGLVSVVSSSPAKGFCSYP